MSERAQGFLLGVGATLVVVVALAVLADLVDDPAPPTVASSAPARPPADANPERVAAEWRDYFASFDAPATPTPATPKPDAVECPTQQERAYLIATSVASAAIAEGYAGIEIVFGPIGEMPDLRADPETMEILVALYAHLDMMEEAADGILAMDPPPSIPEVSGHMQDAARYAKQSVAAMRLSVETLDARHAEEAAAYTELAGQAASLGAEAMAAVCS